MQYWLVGSKATARVWCGCDLPNIVWCGCGCCVCVCLRDMDRSSCHACQRWCWCMNILSGRPVTNTLVGWCRLCSRNLINNKEQTMIYYIFAQLTTSSSSYQHTHNGSTALTNLQVIMHVQPIIMRYSSIIMQGMTRRIRCDICWYPRWRFFFDRFQFHGGM